MVNTQDECILNKYEEFYVIGQKDKGSVSLVMDRENNRLAVKKYCKSKQSDVYHMLKNINTGFIPQIYHICDEEDGFFIIEEYIEGKTLQEMIDSGQRMEKETIFHLLEQLCSVMKILHNLEKPIIHRDIKPSNIIISNEGDLKLIDFDAAREYKKDTYKDTVCLGTIEYAPPEQFGYSQTDARSDIYSIGRVIAELIKAQGGTKAEYLRSLQEIANKCTMFDPEQRYQSIKELESSIKKAKKSGGNSKGKNYFLMYRLPVFIIGAMMVLYIIYYNDKANTINHGSSNKKNMGFYLKDANEKIPADAEDKTVLTEDKQKESKGYDEKGNYINQADAEEDAFKEAVESKGTDLDDVIRKQADDKKQLPDHTKILPVDEQDAATSDESKKEEENKSKKEEDNKNKKEESLQEEDYSKALSPTPFIAQSVDLVENESPSHQNKDYNKSPADNWYEQTEEADSTPLISGYIQPVFRSASNTFCLSGPEDVVIEVEWNDAKKIIAILKENDSPYLTSEDYFIEENRLVIRKEFLMKLPAGRYQWCILFDTNYGNMITIDIFD